MFVCDIVCHFCSFTYIYEGTTTPTSSKATYSSQNNLMWFYHIYPPNHIYVQTTLYLYTSLLRWDFLEVIVLSLVRTYMLGVSSKERICNLLVTGLRVRRILSWLLLYTSIYMLIYLLATQVWVCVYIYIDIFWYIWSTYICC